MRLVPPLRTRTISLVGPVADPVHWTARVCEPAATPLSVAVIENDAGSEELVDHVEVNRCVLSSSSSEHVSVIIGPPCPQQPPPPNCTSMRLVAWSFAVEVTLKGMLTRVTVLPSVGRL